MRWIVEGRWWLAIGLLLVWIVFGCAATPDLDRLLILQEQDGRIAYSEWVAVIEPGERGPVRQVRFVQVERPAALLIQMEPGGQWYRIDNPCPDASTSRPTTRPIDDLPPPPIDPIVPAPEIPSNPSPPPGIGGGDVPGEPT